MFHDLLNMYCPKCKSKFIKNTQTCKFCGFKADKTSDHSDKTFMSGGSPFNVSKKNRIIAVLCVTVPTALVILIIVLYAIMMEIGMSGKIASGIEGALAILFFLGIALMAAGVPLAAFFGSRRKEPVTQFDKRSGIGEQSEFPPELKKWNWAAAGLPIIWGMYHGVWLSFITLIPYVNWIWWIIMGLEGNKWAWEKRYWKSVDEFKEAQRKWQVWGIIFFFLPVIVVILGLIIGIISTL